MGITNPKQLAMKNGEMFTIRTALPDDAEKILSFTKAIIREADYLVTTEDEFHFTAKEQEQFLKDMLTNDGKLAIVAEFKGEIIGFLDFHNGNKKRISHQGAFGMSVAKAYRNQGVGRGMLESLIQWAKDNPLIEKVCLEVFAKNIQAISLYKKFGFIEEGRKRKAVKFDNNEYDDLILMAYFV